MEIGATQPGRRVHVSEGGYLRLKPGDYGRDRGGEWRARPPTAKYPGLGDEHPLSGSLAGHEVVEHEDGTITVSPSILISYPWGAVDTKQEIAWHGYLERGVWRRVP